jgi:hypothetical protein
MGHKAVDVILTARGFNINIRLGEVNCTKTGLIRAGRRQSDSGHRNWGLIIL